jgi:LPS-assembly protein
MLRSACLLVSTFTFLLLCQLVHAASTTRILTKDGGAVLISAASMFSDYEKQTVNLVGDVQITFGGQSMRCDRALMDKKTGKFVAEGNFILASPTAYVEGSRAEISYEDNTGLIYDGFVKSGQVLFQGQLIRKTGPETYIAEKASYTACTTCPPAWSFSGTHIDAEIGSYAYIKSAWFYLAGFRFFWLPYLIVPLKSERQTGILFPSFDFEKGGVAFGVPFFWAISRSQDLTFTPKVYFNSRDPDDSNSPYEVRNVKALFNYRYVFTEDSGGEMNFGFSDDQIFANDTKLPTLPGPDRAKRWFLSHNHIYTLPGGYINRVRLALVSDLRYPRDFTSEILGLGDPALENKLSLTKNSETLHSSIEAAYYVNQLKADPLDNNLDSVHRFPEFKQSGVDRSLFGSRVFLRWDFNYVNFAREDLSYDDVISTTTDPFRQIDRSRGSGGTGSGTYQPGIDLIRTGQRLDLRPEISAPFRLGKYFDLLPSLQLRHTQYSFNVTVPPGTAFDVIPTRQYVRGRLALRTQISRVYDLDVEEPENETEKSDEIRSPDADAANVGIFSALQPPKVKPKPERMKHEIEPEISVSGIPWLQQTDSTFFGDNSLSPIFVEGQPVSDSDFFSTKGLQFDYEDRITSRNTVSAQVSNRFVKKIWNGETPSYRQVVLIKNGVSYEFDKPNRDANANFSDFYTTVDARFDYFDTNTSVRYFPLHRVFNTSSRARFIDSIGNYVQLSFSQNFLITENVEEAYAKRDENLGVAIGFVHRYATIATEINYLPATYSPIDLRMKSWSAFVKLKPPGDCWGLTATISHILSEDSPRWNLGLDYNFGGASQ